MTRRTVIAILAVLLGVITAGQASADPAPGASIVTNPSTLDFGNVKVGGSDSKDIVVTNNGSVTLGSPNASVSLGDALGFSITNDGCESKLSLVAGDTCTVTVAFSPSAVGLADGTITVNGNPEGGGDVSSASTALTGAGVQPAASFDPSGLSFTTSKGTTSGDQTLHLHNTGIVPLTVNGDPQLGGNNPLQFEFDGGTCFSATQIGAGGECTVNVRYHPTTLAAVDANVTVPTELVTDPSATLNGSVLLPGISLTPTGITFGSQQDGTLGAGRGIVVKNTGQGALHIFGTAIVGVTPLNFSKGTDGCAGHTLGQDETCTVFVRFSPKGRGARSAKLRVASDAGPADLAYAFAGLSGTSVAPASVVGLHGAVGCTRSRLTWASVEAPRFLRVKIVRNYLRIPRGPFDGSVREHSSGYLLDLGLAQLRTYHYAVYGVYSAWDSKRLIYSRANIRTLRTGRVCTPMNGSMIRDLTPFVDWTGYGTNPRYAIRLVRNGATILIRFPASSQYQIPLHWTYNGQSRGLVHGGVYYLYVYAYTKTYPNGRWIGQTKFTEG